MTASRPEGAKGRPLDSEQTARLFYELYRAHRDVLADVFALDDFGYRNPDSYDDISDLNEAALVLTFDALLARIQTP